MEKKTRLDVVMDELLRVSGNKYTYDKILTGYRLTSANGRRDISPRLTLKPFITWVEAFLAGYEDGFEEGHEHVVKMGT